VFKELKRLSVADYPNACGVVFRVFFEMLVANYMDKTGKVKPLLRKHEEAIAKQRAKGKDVDGGEWYPTLRQNFSALLADPNSGLELHPQARKALKHMAEDKYSPLSIDRLDQFVHNVFFTPTEQQLREFWAVSEEFLSQLLREPPPPSAFAGKGP
jgi:hypothetical protein